MTSPIHDFDEFQVKSDNCRVSKDYIESTYDYNTTKVFRTNKGAFVKPVKRVYNFRTKKKVMRTGLMLVGIGGNNGTTALGAILANKHNLTWESNRGTMKPNYFGSICYASTSYLGCDNENRQVYVPLYSYVPMLHPNEMVISGWDINNMPLDEAMFRAQVFPINLQKKIAPYLKGIVPLKSIYYPDFIASNQEDRANNVLKGEHACQEHLDHLRKDIANFRRVNRLDNVVVLWTGNTERYSKVIKGVHDTEKNFLNAIRNRHSEIAQSQIFGAAALLEGCAFINGSPQNTFCPALIQMARSRGLFITGDDFKSGQTKMKSVLVDFLVSSGLKPESIVSYNHLGNNDGKNLAEYKQFRSKEISKSNVVDDMVNSNKILYDKENEHPDHTVVIKYVPHVQDSKRAMDEYISTIFMNGWNTISLHNTCEDSLLAAPLIIDLVVLSELFQRIEWKLEGEDNYKPFDSVLTTLAFLTKAPLVPDGTPLVNALFKQRACIENILRACVGLPPIHNMLLEYKTTGAIQSKL